MQTRILMPLEIIMRLFYIVLFYLISSCTEHKINYYNNETPKINLNEFFNGKLLAPWNCPGSIRESYQKV